jgi:trigger factor
VRRLIEMRVQPASITEREEELRKEAAENAEKNIKGYVVINEIGDAEGIEVNEEDFEKEAEAIQVRTGMEMDVVQKFLQQDDQRDSYESRIFRQKAMEVVISSATVTEKEVSSEELEADDEQQES